ncbi:MAG: PEP-CTERM sorting domain-containing protein [Alphaproteobacteria bacterium]|jgi:hypothetical protein|nr:PEP-CTERM sorting domain-containing protein [Alphaproteobacteria bacterium]MDP6567535.1 PEP-CTERM sorting domain-containing protein [Alphaproteobacteria bacterium]
MTDLEPVVSATRRTGRLLRSFSAGIVGLCAVLIVGAAAQAAPIVSGGELIGATDVDVGGTLYDVAFVEGSCIDEFGGCDEPTDFAFTTLADATLAAQALLDQVFVDSVAGNFDTDPTLTFGCSDPFGCGAVVPYMVMPPLFLFSQMAVNAVDEIDDQVNSFDILVPVWPTEGFSELVFAKFTVATATPEPTGVALFGLALLALAGLRLRRR